jgi:hypothetical protein
LHASERERERERESEREREREREREKREHCLRDLAELVELDELVVVHVNVTHLP